MDAGLGDILFWAARQRLRNLVVTYTINRWLIARGAATRWSTVRTDARDTTTLRKHGRSAPQGA
jgi:hypothetical protein